MKKNILSIGLLVSLLAVGALTSNVRKEGQTLEVRDVLVEDFGNEASGRLVRREANEVASNNLSNVKAQISSVTEENTRHIRFVAALDSYLYEEVSFTITASNGEETKTLVNNEVVTTAYTHVEAGEATLSASEAFGEGYTYLVAYTINNVPESAWGFSFSATVSARATGYDASVSQSATRVISDMAAVEDEMTAIKNQEIATEFRKILQIDGGLTDENISVDHGNVAVDTINLDSTLLHFGRQDGNTYSVLDTKIKIDYRSTEWSSLSIRFRAWDTAGGYRMEIHDSFIKVYASEWVDGQGKVETLLVENSYGIKDNEETHLQILCHEWQKTVLINGECIFSISEGARCVGYTYIETWQAGYTLSIPKYIEHTDSASFMNDYGNLIWKESINK